MEYKIGQRLACKCGCGLIFTVTDINPPVFYCESNRDSFNLDAFDDPEKQLQLYEPDLIKTILENYDN